MVWGVILLLNQIFIFGACFAPYCLIAATPHTAIIAGFLVYFIRRSPKETSERTSSSSIFDCKSDRNNTKSHNEMEASPGNSDIEHKTSKSTDNKILREQPEQWVVKELSRAEALRQVSLQLGLTPEQRAVKKIYPDQSLSHQQTFTKTPREGRKQDYWPKQKESSKDPLIKRGEDYEKFIGLNIEGKGQIVIYNGFIRGRKDRGVDIIAISEEKKQINLIQCKNWINKKFEMESIQSVKEKLDQFDIELYLHGITAYEVYEHYKGVSEKDIEAVFNKIRKNPAKYTIRKTLYLASDKVINLEIGRYLKMIKEDIFRYEDMKMVLVDAGVIPGT